VFFVSTARQAHTRMQPRGGYRFIALPLVPKEPQGSGLQMALQQHVRVVAGCGWKGWQDHTGQRKQGIPTWNDSSRQSHWF
ncbi:hypothetical protein, partial [Leisingera sp. MMG026]|uniref:hypothetical protein n=1 Tax=Leisingera sp. MMG026 TaxID=2909982 RepID=UPI001F263DB1